MKPTLSDTLPHKETPFLRILHILVALLVLAQIINSNFTESEALHESGLNGIVTWIHVICGFGLIFCGIAMMAWMLTQRGFKYYFAAELLTIFAPSRSVSFLTRMPAVWQQRCKVWACWRCWALHSAARSGSC